MIGNCFHSSMRRVAPTLFVTMSGLALSLSMAGCGDSVAPAAPIHPVKGKVKLEGPGSLAGMKVLFLPNPPGSGARTASGELEADGSFVLTTTENGDGIAEGDYKVCLKKITAVMDKKSKPAPSTVPSQYLDEDASGLTATIKPDTTEVGPFVLTAQKNATAAKRGRVTD